MEETKVCSRCPEGQNVKPVTAFYKSKAYKDGMFSYCKECFKQAEARPERVAKRKAYKAQYHIDHAAKINARSVQWGKDHPERMNAKNKRSKDKHKEQILAQASIYRMLNRVLCALRAQKSRRKKPGYYRAKNKTWREKNPNKLIEYFHKRRAILQNIPFVETVDIEVLLLRDKGICGICNQRIRSMQDASRDHIIPVTVEGSEHSYRNMVIAHKWCNSSKGNRAVPQQMRLF